MNENETLQKLIDVTDGACIDIGVIMATVDPVSELILRTAMDTAQELRGNLFRLLAARRKRDGG